MLYLFIDKNRIKVLSVKKTLLGQYESAFYERKHSVNFLDENGGIANTDLLASAIKEATTSLFPAGLKDKETCLILPQESFQFMRTEVPADVAPSAVNSFVIDKARASITKELDSYLFDYLVSENEKQNQIIFYAVDKELLKSYQDALSLVDLHVNNVIPESLAYFKLFEKTLRKDKGENILYAIYDPNEIIGYLYDSHGPLDNKQWRQELTESSSIEEVLKTKVTEYENEGRKLNRLILSGENSDSVRQDTFTKNVGVWMNPLKRIIPQFYQDYLKIFIIPSDKTLPLLQYDVCIGAFIFALENKNFSLMKKKFVNFSTPSLPSTSFNFPKRELAIFIVSFALSFATFIALSKLTGGGIKAPTFLAAKPTATPTPPPPTPTPTIAVDRKELKVKVLNGTGITGKAGKVKEALKTVGYEDILTGNADNTDYTTTEIQVKEDKESLAAVMASDLKDSASSPKVTTLADKEASDIVLIIGKDFK